MSNVFLLYIPPGNHEARVHYEDTLVKRVPLERIGPFVKSDLKSRLRGIFGVNPIAVWGSQGGDGNRRKFEQMRPGDDILVVEGQTIKLIGKIAAKTENRDLSRDLWKPLGAKESRTWELIYFIANPRELKLEFRKFCRLFGYESSYRLRGFSCVSAERLKAFNARYDDLYSILVRLQNGDRVLEKVSVAGVESADPESLMHVQQAAVDDVIAKDDVSEHIRMQWKLARLGIKAGERVWVPAGDQTKLVKHYEFDSFDREFASGIDLPHSYVENIDVVWKQEFRIGAAYEIENSTAIYSGLLRFADLNILAPNTLYPMFIVAPAERKNRVRDQLRRPTFRRLDLDKKVRFLSYEAINEIDDFFAESDGGLTVEMIVGKSETAA
ncbi:MAG TPA: hypothetical protein VJR92_03560 [Gemmatimonadaceae bacterium]|nr:hypothetical protein [Gemmatimonadaceae bacterium]